MSITLVQHAIANQASGTSISQAFGSNVTSGNLLLGVVTDGNQNLAAWSISDTLSSTWNPTTAQAVNSTATSVQLFWALANGTGADTVQITGLVNSTSILSISEWSGVNNIDQTGTWANGTATTQTSNSITTLVASELLIGVAAYTTIIGSLVTLSAGASQILVDEVIQGVTLGLLVEYQILSSTGTYTVAASNTVAGKGASPSWSINAFSFQSPATTVRLLGCLGAGV